MKTFILALATLLASTAARADGFLCHSFDGDLNVKVFNRTDQATRSAAVLVLSDPRVAFGRKTIATFRGTSSTLTNSGPTYSAIVEAGIAETGRGGELIAGTKLAYVSALTLYVHFDYNHPLSPGEEVTASLVLQKTNGERQGTALVCARYLKGE